MNLIESNDSFQQIMKDQPFLFWLKLKEDKGDYYSTVRGFLRRADHYWNIPIGLAPCLPSEQNQEWFTCSFKAVYFYFKKKFLT